MSAVKGETKKAEVKTERKGCGCGCLGAKVKK